MSVHELPEPLEPPKLPKKIADEDQEYNLLTTPVFIFIKIFIIIKMKKFNLLIYKV
jgi:hypothetical protein